MKTRKHMLTMRAILAAAMLSAAAATPTAGALVPNTPAADTIRFRLRFNPATENAGTALLEVTREGEAAGLATVDYATVPFTATAGVDYQSGSGQITFQAGETSKAISITLLDDAAQEGAESFNVLLSNPTGADLGAITNASVSIDDNEKPFLVDPSFNPTSAGFRPERVLPLPDGRVLIIGFFTEFGGAVRNGLARLNADGSLDTTYDAQLGEGGVFRWSMAPDGKLVIYGFFTEVAGQPRNGLARLNPDGSLDESFDPAGWNDASPFVGTVVAQPDGKVILCGSFTTIHGQPRNHIARLNADGSLDESFDAGAASGGNTGVVDAVLQNDGKIVVCGSFTNWSSVARSRVARLNTDGTLDPNWAPQTDGAAVFIGSFLIRRLALRADGKLFIQGDGLQRVNGEARRGFALLNDDGSLDAAFVPGNLFFIAVNWFAALPNGGLLAAGSMSTAAGGNYAFVRLGPDGSFDLPFDTDLGYNGNDAQVTADGNYLVTGFFSEIGGVPRHGLARLFSDGTGRQGFNFVGSGASAHEAGGKVLVTVQRRGESSGSLGVNVPLAAGSASAGADYLPFSGAVTFAPLETHKSIEVPLVRDRAAESDENFTASLGGTAPGVLLGRSTATLWILDDDRAGSVEPAFRFGTGGLPIPPFEGAGAPALLPNGKFLASVSGYDFNTDEFAAVVARFNADGSPDLSFPPFPVPGISQVTLMNGGRRFLVNRGDSVLRLLGDGTLDTNFNLTVSPADEFDYAYISDVLVQPDQKIVIAGHFSFVNGVPRKNIARLRVTGAVDMSFDPGAGPDDTINDVALQPDGKLVIGGWFFNVGTEERLFLARLYPNGLLDDTFHPGASFTDPYGGVPYLQHINVQPDGRMLISGFFDSYQGAPQFSLVRVLPDGSRDTSFNPGTGFTDSYDPAFPGFVIGTTVQPDGKILASGNYGGFNGTRATGIVRLNANGSLDPAFQLTGTALLEPFNGIQVSSPAVLLPDGDTLVPALGVSSLFSLRGIVRLNGDPDEKGEK